MTTPGRDGERATCELCGEPMPPGEEMFKYHGFSGDCPKPPLPKPQEPDYKARCEALETALREKVAEWHGMRALAEAEGPIVGDEIGHASRWEMARIFTDELRALLSAEPPASKEEQ